jgi:hypothetical protein
LFESGGPSWLEVLHVHDNVVWDIGKVQKYHDHVRLLKFVLVLLFQILQSRVLLFTIHYKLPEAIFDNLFSFPDEGANIEELLSVELVGQYLIPRSALHSFPRNVDFIQFPDGVRIIRDESIIPLHVKLFSNEFISLSEFDSFKEAW